MCLELFNTQQSDKPTVVKGLDNIRKREEKCLTERGNTIRPPFPEVILKL
jgi:hypothetical protein